MPYSRGTTYAGGERPYFGLPMSNAERAARRIAAREARERERAGLIARVAQLEREGARRERDFRAYQRRHPDTTAPQGELQHQQQPEQQPPPMMHWPPPEGADLEDPIDWEANVWGWHDDDNINPNPDVGGGVDPPRVPDRQEPVSDLWDHTLEND